MKKGNADFLMGSYPGWLLILGRMLALGSGLIGFAVTIVFFFADIFIQIRVDVMTLLGASVGAILSVLVAYKLELRYKKLVSLIVILGWSLFAYTQARIVFGYMTMKMPEIYKANDIALNAAIFSLWLLLISGITLLLLVKKRK